MSGWNHVHSFKDFDKYFVGFDRAFAKMSTVQDELTKLAGKYPPYNIKKIDENRYVIEMAVAGFGKQDLEIELADGRLVIKGNTQSDNDDQSYLYKGIATRAFQREFQLADTVEIQSADLLNGMLKIWLEAIIPDHKKPKQIPINSETTETTAIAKK